MRCEFFFKLYAFILSTSTIVPGINYFAVTTHPLHQLQVRKRSSSSCYMIETYNTRHRFPFVGEKIRSMHEVIKRNSYSWVRN